MRRRKENDTDPDGPPSYEDAITEGVYLISVTGRTLKEILDNARIQAARVLDTRPENIYIKSNTDATIAEWQRFGDQQKPVLWKCSVSCGLVPEHLRIG